MANHNYQQFQYCLEKYPVSLFLNVPIGASGAVGTLDPKKNQGIYSVVRSSAGVYVITFGFATQRQIDKYIRLLMAQAVVLDSTVAGMGFEVVADAAAAGNITVKFTAPTSSSDTTVVATDPPSGAVLLIKIELKNSTV